MYKKIDNLVKCLYIDFLQILLTIFYGKFTPKMTATFGKGDKYCQNQGPGFYM
jgi:hypothetical protein